jgi:mRNA-degrading endonuclease toxin of MazEF toxin-antitoxin module
LRDTATAVAVGSDEAVDRHSVASFDNLTTVPKSMLTVRLGALARHRRHEMGAALNAMADC